MENLSAVLYAKGDLRLEKRAVPEPKDDEVLLRVHSVGVCGSDIHYWVHGTAGHFVVKGPLVLGHETSGIVTKCGKNVKDLKPGDRVAIEPGVPCRYCEHCKTGRYNLCNINRRFSGTLTEHGSLCQYYAHAADFCHKCLAESESQNGMKGDGGCLFHALSYSIHDIHKHRLPPNVTMDEGAFLEPLSVAVHACRRAGLSAGQRVLITGAGAIGLVSLLVAKAMCAGEVCITDVNDERLKMAKSLGADHTLNITGKSVDDLAKEVAKVLEAQPDVTIECCGFEDAVRLAIIGTKPGGTIMMVGLGSQEIKVPLVLAAAREVDVKGIFRYANCYPIALDMIASGKINVKPLMTHRFSLEETLKAYETARSGKGIKIMIQCGADGK